MPRDLARPEGVFVFLPADVIPRVRSEMEARRMERIHGIGLPFLASTSSVGIALLVVIGGRVVEAASPGAKPMVRLAVAFEMGIVPPPILLD